MGRLNEQKLQALLKENKPVVVAVGDGTGLSFRLTPTGASWQLRYRHGGRPHWLTLGKYPVCSLKDAQKAATKERARIDDGVDPVGERRRSKLVLKAAKVFRDLAADYVARALPDLKPGTQTDFSGSSTRTSCRVSVSSALTRPPAARSLTWWRVSPSAL